MLSSPASHELADLALGTEAYAEQVSRDFEELTWLRCLSEQLESCDATSPLDHVAQRVLPELRTTIRAEAIVLLGSRPGEAPADRKPQFDFPIFTAGTLLIREQTWPALIETLTTNARRYPLIRNRISAGGLPAGCMAIHSCIVVPVARQDVQYGWLIALNRVRRDANPFLLDLRPGALPGDDEFGTEEAGLLHAAARALAGHARNAQLLREKELLLIGVVRALINAIDAKDAYTWGHSDRVALIARRLGEELQLGSQECERLYTSGLLHDIGKIGVPDKILQKAGPLTDEEFNEIKKHPQIGYDILQHLQQLGYVLPGVLYHHESIDGRGYPHALQGDDIPLFGRILAVADTYDAMTSSRPYRTALSPDVARSRLREGAGRQWDARVVGAFLDCSEDIQRLCGDARGRAMHGTAMGRTAAADEIDARGDAVPSDVTALHKQQVP
jgi:HD-GYP domain-containing protein (c-di-GMP phosphodiesterase class II)